MTHVTSADVVVIGGGVLGVTAAHHLHEAGAGRVVVVERDDIAGGTTSAGAGFLGLWSGGYLPGWGPEELEVERYTLDYYAGLAREAEIGYRNNGLLWVATTPEQYTERIVPIHDGGHDPDRRLLTPEEIGSLTPLLEPSEIAGGVVFPSGAQVTAKRATQAVARKIEDLGVIVETRCPVEEILVRGGRVTGVRTTWGKIHAGAVVLAAGAWSNTLLRGLDTWVPQMPLVLTRLVTVEQGIDPGTPGTYLPEHDGLWFREERGGLLWGCELKTPVRHRFVDQDPPDRLDEIPIDPLFDIQAAGRKAAHIAPVLAAEVSMTVAQGLPTYTPDSRPLVGPVPGLEALVLVGGCNESGVSHAPGFGRIVADLVTIGPDAGPAAFRLDRFGPQVTDNRSIVTQMSTNSGAYFR